jgi:hypothetical protein
VYQHICWSEVCKLMGTLLKPIRVKNID